MEADNFVSVRYYIEIVAAVALLRAPEHAGGPGYIIESFIAPRLLNFRNRNPIIASVLMVRRGGGRGGGKERGEERGEEKGRGGYLRLYHNTDTKLGVVLYIADSSISQVLGNSLPTLLQREREGEALLPLLERIRSIVSPWLGCATSHVRVTCLCIYQQVITRLAEAWGKEGGKEGRLEDNSSRADVAEYVRFARENKDIMRMSRRHLADFAKFDAMTCSTLDAIIGTPVNEYHEFFPPDSVQEVRYTPYSLMLSRIHPTHPATHCHE